MATKNPTNNPLESAKLGADGKELHNEQKAKVQASDLIAAAKQLFPNGLPLDSPFAKASKDELLQAANMANMPFGALMSPEELALVLEFGRVKLSQLPAAKTPVGSTVRDVPPPVPLQPLPAKPPGARKIRGVPPSETNMWRVKNAQPKTCSLQGQIFQLRPGAVIELRHYGPDGMRALAEQGVEFEPITEGEED